MDRMKGYIFNCFWLLLPVLAFNALFGARLPAAFQSDIFWRDIPAWIAIPENTARIGTLVLPLLMPLGWTSQRQRIGWLLYAVGLALYLAAWLALMLAPESLWSTSAAGFAAGAYTPLLWLAGIGLIGEGGLMRRYPALQWLYALCCVVFLAAHNTHALTVYFRLP